MAGHRRRRPSVKNDETGLRERRNYREVAGTEAHRIMTTGLRPFAPLTKAQERMLAQREEESAPPIPGGMGGGVGSV